MHTTTHLFALLVLLPVLNSLFVKPFIHRLVGTRMMLLLLRMRRVVVMVRPPCVRDLVRADVPCDEPRRKSMRLVVLALQRRLQAPQSFL